MRATDHMRTAAEVLVDQLIDNGVRHVFCVPGESYLAVLDAFHDRDIAVTVCRQEGGAAMMADAVGVATEIQPSPPVPEIRPPAFHTRTSRPPGPVVVALPQDMLTERITARNAPP